MSTETPDEMKLSWLVWSERSPTMNVKRRFSKSLVNAALFGSLVVGCGASGSALTTGQGGSSTNESGGNSDVGGGDPGVSTGGADSTSVGVTTGGSKSTSTGAAGGAKATGGSKATGGTPGTGGVPVITCNSNLTSNGCTAVTPPNAGSLNGQYGTANLTIGGKQYFLQVNEWGSSAAQSLSYGGGVFFKMTQQQASVSASGAPTGYPSVFIGSNSGHTTSGSGLPKAVSSLGTVLTTWNWADNGAMTDSTNNIFNAAYDVWFSTGSGGDSGSVPSGGFLMVWYYAQGCQPVGGLLDAGHTIDGLPGCWDVWGGTNQGKPVISYKHQGPILSFGFDLNLFIKDALAHYPTYMKSSWYLTNIFSGFEIWKGGAALQSTSFCAEVN